ncbi:MAG: dTMP kinase [Pseudomonadaceae bacterium]|nr:dTMP kinase [Pseudomonadaceae bacterium]
MTEAPYYIALDGLDGSGKSSQLNLLVRALLANGIDCHHIREPGGTDVGAKLREIVLTGEHDKLDGIGEALLFSADRRQTMLKVTKPALDAGQWVVSDRSFLTTTVFQGYGRGLSLELLETLHRIAIEDVRPHVQIILDIPVEIGLSRKGVQIEAGLDEARFENMGVSFHQRVREGYHAEAAKDDHIVLVDADADLVTVHNRVVEALNGKLGISLTPLPREKVLI